MKENGLTCETLDEWREQVLKFHEHICDTRVMSCEKRRVSLVHGFTVMWLRLAMALPEADRPEADRLFVEAMTEYTTREEQHLAAQKETP